MNRTTEVKRGGEAKFVHAVYFTLAEDSPESRDKLVRECFAYLREHPGLEYFNAGVRAAGMDRPVNDQAFDVSLTLVFDSRRSHDDYQVSPKHKEFIERNRASWKQVRVFDSEG